MLYDQKTKYLEYMEKGGRVRGAGFVKMERWGKTCSLTLQISGLPVSNQGEYRIYLEGKKQLGSQWEGAKRDPSLGSVTLVQGKTRLEFRDLDCENLMDSGYAIEDVERIRIPLGPDRELLCILQESRVGASPAGDNVNGESVRKVAEKKQSGSAEESEIRKGDGAPEERNVPKEGGTLEEGQFREVDSAPEERNVPKEGGGPEEGQIREVDSAPEERNVPKEGGALEEGQFRKGDSAPEERNVPKEGGALEEGQFREVDSAPEERNVPKEGGGPEEGQIRGVDSAPEERNVPKEGSVPEIRSALQEDRSLKGYQEVGESQPYAFKTSLQPNKWEQLRAIYPPIVPFGDNREYLRISPGDFVILKDKSYRLANNSFLLHGYFNYKHLILHRTGRKGETIYYVGVPGNFYDKEKEVAILFGFESFECAREPAGEGDFGYYMMRVEL